mmetsp:Transcript_56100/g.135888  ORF Transcript_56100/g.135888 Transcript_56100/m.135888 type:complete len:226 (-) Transcript_56100:2935-3612(-)
MDVVKVHVASRETTRKTELLMDATLLLFPRIDIIFRGRNREVDGRVRVVLDEVLDVGAVRTLRIFIHHLFQLFLVILGPYLDRQLGDLKGGIIKTFDTSSNFVFTVTSWFNFTTESGKARFHGLDFFTVNQLSNVVDNRTWVVVGNSRRPTSTNSITSVDKDGWNDRHKMLRLNRHAVIRQVCQQLIVVRVEDGSSDLLELRKDVTRRCTVLSSHPTSTKLSSRC